MRWRDWQPRLEKDRQGRASNPALSVAEMQEAFEEFAAAAMRKAVTGFR